MDCNINNYTDIRKHFTAVVIVYIAIDDEDDG